MRLTAEVEFLTEQGVVSVTKNYDQISNVDEIKDTFTSFIGDGFQTGGILELPNLAKGNTVFIDTSKVISINIRFFEKEGE